MLTIGIAGITVGIENRYRHIEYISRDYVTSGEPAFTVRASDEEIAAERLASGGEYNDAYLESTVIHRKIAERLWEIDAFVLHGAVISVDGAAYAFTAASGTGKSTHTRLWCERFGERVEYVNGDKPIVRFIDGVPYVYGTPWRGKEGYGRNVSVPLRGIAYLERSVSNFAEELSFDEISSELMSRVYLPRTPLGAARTLGLVGRLASDMRHIRLGCNMETEAAEVAARAFGIAVV